MNGYNLIKKKPVLWLTMVAVLMAMNVVLSSFSIPVPGGHLYLNDIVICTAAILLDPLGAFIVGGVGAFLGDFFFYPAPMFVSLASHGLEAVVVSLCAHNLFKEKRPWARASAWCWGLLSWSLATRWAAPLSTARRSTPSSSCRLKFCRLASAL